MSLKRQNDACQAYTDSPVGKWSTGDRQRGKHSVVKKIQNAMEAARINTGNDITVEGEEGEIMVGEDGSSQQI